MAAQNNAPLPDGLEIGGYRIVKKIASGGFSIVYLAYDGDGNAVAIKEYLPSSLALRQPGQLIPLISKANLPVFRIGLKCFFEEGRALAKIVHPNVVRVLNFFRANDTVYMVMAYESGHSLQEQISRLLAKGQRASEGFIRQAFNGVCGGLREVHANMLLHLDLKPANIYLRLDGTPLLLDFGAARQTINTDARRWRRCTRRASPRPSCTPRAPRSGPGPTSTASARPSTPAWPARRRKRPTSARSRTRWRPASQAGRAYSPELLAMVKSCLALDPLARPQSVFAVQKVLQAGGLRPTAAAGKHRPKKKPRHPAGAAWSAASIH
jgi:hypothetical protein